MRWKKNDTKLFYHRLSLSLELRNRITFYGKREGLQINEIIPGNCYHEEEVDETNLLSLPLFSLPLLPPLSLSLSLFFLTIFLSVKRSESERVRKNERQRKKEKEGERERGKRDVQSEWGAKVKKSSFCSRIIYWNGKAGNIYTMILSLTLSFSFSLSLSLF